MIERATAQSQVTTITSNSNIENTPFTVPNVIQRFLQINITVHSILNVSRVVIPSSKNSK